jgi:hypothetical protein
VVVLAVLVDFRFSNYQNCRHSSSHCHQHSSKQQAAQKNLTRQ